jgi:hypothetical protein
VLLLAQVALVVRLPVLLQRLRVLLDFLPHLLIELDFRADGRIRNVGELVKLFLEPVDFFLV